MVPLVGSVMELHLVRDEIDGIVTEIAEAAGLALDIPIFTGGRIHAQLARASLEEQRIEENRRLLEARIVREVKSAID